MSIKQKIHQACITQVTQSLEAIEQRLSSVRESRNNETKSSAGDKYETSRAMMQIEEDNLNVQKVKILDHHKRLASIDANLSQDTVQLGSLVLTNQLQFYISIALGKIKIDDSVYYAISPVSPIGQQLVGQQKGNTFIFNGKTYEVLEIL